MHYGALPTQDYDGYIVRNLSALVTDWFHIGWYVVLYVLCMCAVGFHLWHGFASAFQSLGLNHLKYNGLIAFVGRAFAIVVPALYALIPGMIYFGLTF